MVAKAHITMRIKASLKKDIDDLFERKRLMNVMNIKTMNDLKESLMEKAIRDMQSLASD